MLSAEQVTAILGLKPLSPEGGLYRETYRSEETIPGGALPGRYRRRKCLCTAIYYLLTPQTHSRLHRVGTPEGYANGQISPRASRWRSVS